MIESAPAKINLFLHVVGRRMDGYHLLDSLVVFPAVGDVLRAEASDQLSLTVAGPFAAGLRSEPDNLVLRAARALAAVAKIPACGRLVLEKWLPVASGIGGGSADAAAALRLLSRLWDVALDDAVMAEVAAGLGADVPACLAGRPARMGGIGERLAAAPTLPEFGLALVNPGVSLATAAVFSQRRGAWSEPARLPAGWGSAREMAGDLSALRNDLAAPAIALCPVIADVLGVLRAQPGCLWAGMSGSGATCFGIFATQAEAGRIAVPPAWWHWPDGCGPGQSSGLARSP